MDQFYCGKFLVLATATSFYNIYQCQGYKTVNNNIIYHL